MNDNKLLNQLGDLIDKKLKPFKKQLESVEMKIDKANERVVQAAEDTNKRIVKSQEETIEAISELINAGYNLHERRIKKIEKHLNLPQTP